MSAIDRAEELLKGLTERPWERTVYPHGGSRIYRLEPERMLICDSFQDGDADFFFEAPSLLADLISEARSLERYLRDAQNTVTGCLDFGTESMQTTLETLRAQLNGWRAEGAAILEGDSE